MTRDEEAAFDFDYGPIPSDIEAMMRAAGFSYSDGYEEWGYVKGSHGALRRLVVAVASAVAAAEREACAKIADEFHPPGNISVGHAIRARGEK
jgi:hypothetical protein